MEEEVVMDLRLMAFHERMLSSVTGKSIQQMRRNVRLDARRMSGISKVAYMRYMSLYIIRMYFRIKER